MWHLLPFKALTPRSMHRRRRRLSSPPRIYIYISICLCFPCTFNVISSSVSIAISSCLQLHTSQPKTPTTFQPDIQMTFLGHFNHRHRLLNTRVAKMQARLSTHSTPRGKHPMQHPHQPPRIRAHVRSRWRKCIQIRRCRHQRPSCTRPCRTVPSHWTSSSSRIKRRCKRLIRPWNLAPSETHLPQRSMSSVASFAKRPKENSTRASYNSKVRATCVAASVFSWI
jgi:hypothetical protein